MTKRGEMGEGDREAQEGGDICILTADSAALQIGSPELRGDGDFSTSPRFLS